MFDLTTIFGLLLGFVLFGLAGFVKSGGNLFLFLDPAAVAITFGGAISGLIIHYPLRDLLQIPSVIKQAFVTRSYNPEELIEELTGYADIARRDGILALEGVIDDVDDDFLVRGIRLAVDGTDPDLIESMMKTELNKLMERHQKGIQVFESLTLFLPSFGMVGTVMGLIVMLQQMDDPDSIGQGMALALMTTFYGAFSGYLIAKPIAEKLKIRSDREVLVKDMIIEGIMSIQSGDNPRVVRQKLMIYLKPEERGEVT